MLYGLQSCRQLRSTAERTPAYVPNVTDDSSDDERGQDAAAANESVASVLSTATAGLAGGGAIAGQGAAGGSQGQLRRRHRPHAAAIGPTSPVSLDSLDRSIVLGDRSTCIGDRADDDEWSAFKGA